MTRVWFVLGYLGSGKTTFVKNFLSRHGGRNAVLVNDFGAEDVDGALLAGAAEKVESIFNGSVFCSCRSEQFVDAMLRLSQEKFDNILVETSGLSNPFQMRKMFGYICSRAANAFTFAGAVCVADAANLEKVLYTLNAVKMQIAAADVILINKTDLVGEETRRRMERAVRELNADAPVYCTVGAFLPSEDFLVRERNLPPLIEDITVQKAKIVFSGRLSAQARRDLCARLSVFCHRIKGVLDSENGHTVYEFSDGAEHFYPTDRAGNFLILLAAGKFSLPKRAEEILKTEGVEGKIC